MTTNFNFDAFIKIVADSWEQIRPCDLDRLFDECPREHRRDLKWALWNKRHELDEQITAAFGQSMGYPPKGTSLWSAYVVRPSGSKANTFKSRDCATPEEAIYECVGNVMRNKGRNVKEIVASHWTATGDGAKSCILYGGVPSRRMSYADALTVANEYTEQLLAKARAEEAAEEAAAEVACMT